VGLNLVALLFNVIANFVAIPRFGALGAAVATALTLAVHNVLKQVVLQRTAGVRMFRRDYARAYLVVASTAAALLLLDTALDRPAVSFAGYAVGCVVVLGTNRRLLQVGDTFPELQRIPLLRKLLP
jgi:O-antigen/teichoic acid export membrane protein